MSSTISMPGLESAMLARSRVERSELELELLSSLMTPWYFRIFSLFDLSTGVGGLWQNSATSPEHTPDSRSMQSVDLEVEQETSASSGLVRDIPVESGVFLTSQSDLRNTNIKLEPREKLIVYGNGNKKEKKAEK